MTALEMIMQISSKINFSKDLKQSCLKQPDRINMKAHSLNWPVIYFLIESETVKICTSIRDIAKIHIFCNKFLPVSLYSEQTNSYRTTSDPGFTSYM